MRYRTMSLVMVAGLATVHFTTVSAGSCAYPDQPVPAGPPCAYAENFVLGYGGWWGSVTWEQDGILTPGAIRFIGGHPGGGATDPIADLGIPTSSITEFEFHVRPSVQDMHWTMNLADEHGEAIAIAQRGSSVYISVEYKASTTIDTPLGDTQYVLVVKQTLGDTKQAWLRVGSPGASPTCTSAVTYTSPSYGDWESISINYQTAAPSHDLFDDMHIAKPALALAC